MKKYLFILTMIGCLFASIANAENPSEASHERRVTAAKAKLADKPDIVTVQVKGLCCSSCAIGIRKKIGKLSFVDKGRLNKGVELDTKVQLATIAVGTGKKVDMGALAQAIDDAGYSAVNLFTLNEGKFEIVPFEES